MGHEVWTVFKSGTYDTQALHILLNFVEKSKALQLKPEETESIITQASNSTTQSSAAILTNLRAPRSVSPNQILVIEANLSYSSKTKMLVRAIALDKRSAQIENVIDLSVVGEGQRAFSFLVSPPFNSSEVSLEIIILHRPGADWLPIAGPYFTTSSIADMLTVTLETTVPNISLAFDGTHYAVSKYVQFETKPGMHIVQLQPIIYLSGSTRAVFTRWEDGTSTPIRQVSMDSNTTLLAFYRKQYFVNATSSYGHVLGSGWYDENSTAAILLQPPMVSEAGVLFSHWTGDSRNSSTRTLLFVDSPKAIQAKWDAVGNHNGSNSLDILVTISPSVIVFVVLLILSLMRTSPIHSSAERIKRDMSHTRYSPAEIS
jgi:hypothetical protein